MLQANGKKDEEYFYLTWLKGNFTYYCFYLGKILIDRQLVAVTIVAVNWFRWSVSVHPRL